jgi:energy-coupling factor transport system substrate-specific component
MPSAAPTVQRSWRTNDIVIAALIAVFGGVLFFLWNTAYGVISAPFAAFPPLKGLLLGGWLIPAVLGALIVRRPGAALFCEVVAAVGEALVGSQWGMAVLISGLLQGLGAELVFLATGYRKYTLPVAVAAGAAAGLFGSFNETFIAGYYADFTTQWKLLYMLFGTISGAVPAGLVSWLLTRGVAATGALSGLSSRSAHREPAL